MIRSIIWRMTERNSTTSLATHLLLSLTSGSARLTRLLLICLIQNCGQRMCIIDRVSRLTKRINPSPQVGGKTSFEARYSAAVLPRVMLLPLSKLRSNAGTPKVKLHYVMDEWLLFLIVNMNNPSAQYLNASDITHCCSKAAHLTDCRRLLPCYLSLSTEVAQRSRNKHSAEFTNKEEF